MQKTSPPTPSELVDSFVEGSTRFDSYLALQEHGEDALPAVREGLKHGNWHVRQWCAIYLDHYADPASLELLVPLLRDPKSKVRLWAVHSIACDNCKDHENCLDVVPHLIERIELDESVRVRRMAVAMLAVRKPDVRAVPVLKSLHSEEDRKLRTHAERTLGIYREAGLRI